MSVWDYRTSELASQTRDIAGYDVHATDGDIGKVDEATSETGGAPPPAGGNSLIARLGTVLSKSAGLVRRGGETATASSNPPPTDGAAS